MDELPKRVAVAWAFFTLGVLAALFALRILAARIYGPRDGD